jgi:hypothetical protein
MSVDQATADRWLKKMPKKPVSMYAAGKRVVKARKIAIYDVDNDFKAWVWQEVERGRLQFDTNYRVSRG